MQKCLHDKCLAQNSRSCGTEKPIPEKRPDTLKVLSTSNKVGIEGKGSRVETVPWPAHDVF